MTQGGILCSIPYLWKEKSPLLGRAIKAAPKNLLTTISLAFQMRGYKTSTTHVLRSIYLPPAQTPDLFPLLCDTI